jgi:periplasmic protein TonB
MTALATPAARWDHGGFRWAFCFAVVAAAHGAAAMALLRGSSVSDSDFLAGAPVMIDLAEKPAAMSTPPSDLAPGPEEAPAEQTPPPREETKPPEQVAEVALPVPEPPKPEPPAEAKPATAPPSFAMAVPNEAAPTAGVETPRPPSAAVLRWQSGLSAQIARAKRYPPKAAERRQYGTAKVAFLIDDDGRVVESSILESSGWPDLDEEALLTVTRAQPYAKPPPGTKPKDLRIIFPLVFSPPKSR